MQSKETKERKDKRTGGWRLDAGGDSGATEGWTGSLVELGVDGDLKVVVVEVGRLLQDRQHVLDHNRTRAYRRDRKKNICPGAGVTHREHVLLVPLGMRLLLRAILRLLRARPLGPHCLRCPLGVLHPRLAAVWGFEHRSERGRGRQPANTEENLP